jgi:hypothetical protein
MHRANSNQWVIIALYTFTVLNFCSISEKLKSAMRHHGYRSVRKTYKKTRFVTIFHIYIQSVSAPNR